MTVIEDVFTLAVTNGIFAALFTLLLFYVLRDCAKREKKYIETIEKLNAHLDAALDIKEEVFEIKDKFNAMEKKFHRSTKKFHEVVEAVNEKI